jgi:hypothetical protein
MSERTSQPNQNVATGADPVSSMLRDSHDHHARLWSALVEHADALIGTVCAGHNDRYARSVLVDFLRGDVLAHLQTEERVLYQSARKVGAHVLVAALEVDHRFLLDLVERIEKAPTALEAALSAHALVVLFALRMEKEDSVVLPTLTGAGVDVSALLDDMTVRMATDYDSHFTYL